MTISNGKLVSASFFWKNDKPGGLGFTFALPTFSSEELTTMFTGPIIEDYMRNSDLALGSNVISDYVDQLTAIAAMPNAGIDAAVLAAYNIIWLTERGMIPNDEFNGPQYVLAQE